MPATTLGAMLHITETCAKADCMKALERDAHLHGPCGERDLRQVQEFFDTVRTEFTMRILAGAEVIPVRLGAGHNNTVALILQTFRWTSDYDIRNPTHPYHAAWRVFDTWCVDNELAPVLRKFHDERGKEHWYELSVRSAINAAEA
ncbi:hypothetical protein [Luteibacter yeojuensis]|uniref:Uncharacterized protein n=1 Tax=Luteibacter yeojuensis TaxID=345309 RepID=A0A7X5QSS2_9GAMM|nr:hypothetical protein [Luteibacter yeojuensis]NID14669.1 hypothetical protein [Luteibacter yeojuensis]